MAACPTPLLLAATHLLRFPLLQLRILLSLSLLCLLPALPRSLLATHFVIDLTVIMCSNNTCNPTGRVCAANPTANSALSPYKQMDQRRGGVWSRQTLAKIAGAGQQLISSASLARPVATPAGDAGQSICIRFYGANTRCSCRRRGAASGSRSSRSSCRTADQLLMVASLGHRQGAGRGAFMSYLERTRRAVCSARESVCCACVCCIRFCMRPDNVIKLF